MENKGRIAIENGRSMYQFHPNPQLNPNPPPFPSDDELDIFINRLLHSELKTGIRHPARITLADIIKVSKQENKFYFQMVPIL